MLLLSTRNGLIEQQRNLQKFAEIIELKTGQNEVVHFCRGCELVSLLYIIYIRIYSIYINCLYMYVILLKR